MTFVADPVGMGLVPSLARPGGNLTGVAMLAGGDFVGKSFGIIRELLPQAKRLAAFINPSKEVHRLGLGDALSAAATLGFQFDIIEVREAEEIPAQLPPPKPEGRKLAHRG